MSFQVLTVRTKPIDGQRTGTSGLRCHPQKLKRGSDGSGLQRLGRKKVAVFEKGNFLPNFVQCLFDTIGEPLIGQRCR
jgi:phosphoglucomutase